MTPCSEQLLTPPLKWAGGKRWLAKRHPALFPEEFSTYYEPFLGGGAVFFHLRPKRAVISDANGDLITTYRAIRKNWRIVSDLLNYHARRHGEEYFYYLRDKKPSDNNELAAWFLYMNRACYNGLYRVNKMGKFNVPKGTKDRIIFSYDDFESLSRALSSAIIMNRDFERPLNASSEGDFVYLDPPYTVRHNNNGFLKYNEEMFSWSDQERLSEAVARAAKRGVKVLVSNADHSSVRELYEGLGEIIRVDRYSIIGGGAAYRSGTSEIAVKVGY